VQLLHPANFSFTDRRDSPPLTDRDELARRALIHTNDRPQERATLAGHVADYLVQLRHTPTSVSGADAEFLIAAANLGSRARSSVMRERGEIDLVPEPESPTRLVTQLERLWLGASQIGATGEQARQVIRAAILGGIPQQRQRALLALLQIDHPAHLNQIAVAARLPTNAAHRAVEDLGYLGILTTAAPGPGATWQISDATRSAAERLWPRPEGAA